jgi:hypothetical protein
MFCHIYFGDDQKKEKENKICDLCRARCKDKSSTSRKLVCQYLFEGPR